MGLNGQKGIHKEEVLKAGRHFIIPGAETILSFPEDVGILTLHNGVNKPEIVDGNMEKKIPAANIQTSEGYFTTLDVSEIIQIQDPIKVLDTFGPGNLYIINGMTPLVQPALRETLGQLDPEDFFNTEVRLGKSKAANGHLNDVFNPQGILFRDTLIRRVKYHNDIQTRIEGKVLETQLIDTNRAISDKNKEQAKLDQIIQEGKNAVTIKDSEADAYVTARKGQQDEYSRIKRSDADRLVDSANAYKTQVINKAYEGAGADLLVGLEMANVLKGIDQILVPAGTKGGLNPLDLDSVVKGFRSELEGGIKK